METASQFQQIMADNPNNPFAGDDRLWVRFEMVPVEDPAKTAEAGRQICTDVAHIEIRTPGDRDNILYRAMTELDKHRFKKRYEEWLKTQTDEPTEGTPLAEVPIFKRREVEELRYRTSIPGAAVRPLDTHIARGPGPLWVPGEGPWYRDVSPGAKEASKLRRKDGPREPLRALTEPQRSRPG
jgi:hypothetical protein